MLIYLALFVVMVSLFFGVSYGADRLRKLSETSSLMIALVLFCAVVVSMGVGLTL